MPRFAIPPMTFLHPYWPFLSCMSKHAISSLRNVRFCPDLQYLQCDLGISYIAFGGITKTGIIMHSVWKVYKFGNLILEPLRRPRTRVERYTSCEKRHSAHTHFRLQILHKSQCKAYCYTSIAFDQLYGMIAPAPPSN